MFRDVEAEEAGEPEHGVDKGGREKELGVVEERESCVDDEQMFGRRGMERENSPLKPRKLMMV